ncbi:MAG: hypothetical protein AAFP13_09805 [Pseudomonadota bacterium]
MAIPLAPIGALVIRYGAVALAGYAAARAIPRMRRDQDVEDTLDTVDEGLATRRDGEQVNATGRFRRVVRLGTRGPGVEIDVTTLNRIRMRRIR